MSAEIYGCVKSPSDESIPLKLEAKAQLEQMHDVVELVCSLNLVHVEIFAEVEQELKEEPLAGPTAKQQEDFNASVGLVTALKEGLKEDGKFPWTVGKSNWVWILPPAMKELFRPILQIVAAFDDVISMIYAQHEAFIFWD